MGITIFYRGRMADLDRIEDFEDRVLDFALEVGGQARIWRTHADDDPKRMVRGLILDLAPGQDSLSLLLSPEGWLIGLMEIEDAECGRLTEPPWCFVKTQFGPLEGHVAVVELLTALRREFMPDLEVVDEGGYYPTRNLAELVRLHSQLQQAIEGMAEGLRRHGLSREAEDPEILRHRIERIAAQVHRVLHRPAEHPPVIVPDEDVPDPEANEAMWDELFKHNRRQQERLQRAIEERRSRGEEDEEAFDNALNDLGLEVPDEEPWPEEEEPVADPPDEVASEEHVPVEAEQRSPLLQRAMDLLKRLYEVFRDRDQPFEPSLHAVFQGAGDTMGGLAQALSGRKEVVEALGLYGLRVTQMKRALRGAAFARGALFPLRSAMTAEQFKELQDTLEQLEEDIFQELSRLRSEHRPDEL